MNISKKSYILPYLNGWLLFLVTFVLLVSLSLCNGSVSIPFSEMVHSLQTPKDTSVFSTILFHVRIPRTIAALLAGSALSLCGLLLQVSLSNPLASPSLLGINTGASFAVILCAVLFPSAYALLPIASFIGAIFITLLLYSIAKIMTATRTTIILCGIALSSIFSACTDTLLTLYPDLSFLKSSILIGGFSNVQLSQLILPGWIIFFCIVFVLVKCYDLNLLQLGDELAFSLGLSVQTTRLTFLVVAALLAGCAVSFSGILSFVGLIIPHVVRRILYETNRTFILWTICFGGLFTLFCDLLARVLFKPYELPVGILLSFIGGPFFLYLLFTRRKMKG